MIARLIGVAVLLWAIGFGVFIATMPAPAAEPHTDAIVVLTGSAGRIDRGLKLLRDHAAKRMLITGVAPEVRPVELARQYHVSPTLFQCCIDLGHEAVDTRSNAEETARWVRRHGYKTVRLVTSDWHLARARLELGYALQDDVVVYGDGVPSSPRFGVLIGEYNKLILRKAALMVGAAP